MIESKKYIDVSSLGAFVISLDFELQYGIEDHSEGQIVNYRQNLLGARGVIGEILRLFKHYEVHATWAIVGMMLAKNRADMERYIPQYLPHYNHEKRSIYSYLERIGEDENDDPVHFGLTLAKVIRDTEGQEIGTHTFSHYYCCYPGQDGQTMKADIEAAQYISEKNLGVKPVSIVLPRNQVNPEYIPVLKKLGIVAYRGCPVPYVYNTVHSGYWIRVRRLLDSYFSIYGEKSYSYNEVLQQGIANVKASNFLRPYRHRLRFMERAKITQIKRGMLEAATKGQIYHLWWHPHNFGVYQKANLNNLEAILLYFQKLKREYGMQSLNMVEVAGRCFTNE